MYCTTNETITLSVYDYPSLISKGNTIYFEFRISNIFGNVKLFIKEDRINKMIVVLISLDCIEGISANHEYRFSQSLYNHDPSIFYFKTIEIDDVCGQ